jgi:chromosome segregation ATPase
MSKGRSGTAGSGYLGVGGKRTNQPNPELLKLKNEIEELQLEKEESRKNLLHFINELDEANQRNKELEKQMGELQASKNNSQNQDSSTTEANESLEGSVDISDVHQSKLRQLEEQLSAEQK